jgi:hypothetical protein
LHGTGLQSFNSVLLIISFILLTVLEVQEETLALLSEQKSVMHIATAATEQ